MSGAVEVGAGSESGARADDGCGLEATADLAAVREDLAEVEALGDELRHRVAHLRAVLPPEQFRLVWALLDAQERLGFAERLLAERAVADGR